MLHSFPTVELQHGVICHYCHFKPQPIHTWNILHMYFLLTLKFVSSTDTEHTWDGSSDRAHIAKVFMIRVVTVSRTHVRDGLIKILEVKFKVVDRVAGEIILYRTLGPQYVAPAQHMRWPWLRWLQHELLAPNLEQSVQLAIAFRDCYRGLLFVEDAASVK